MHFHLIKILGIFLLVLDKKHTVKLNNHVIQLFTIRVQKFYNCLPFHSLSETFFDERCDSFSWTQKPQKTKNPEKEDSTLNFCFSLSKCNRAFLRLSKGFPQARNGASPLDESWCRNQLSSFRGFSSSFAHKLMHVIKLINLSIRPYYIRYSVSHASNNWRAMC